MGHTVTNSTKKPRVLLVDDEAAILYALDFFLKHKGNRVKAVTKFDTFWANLEKSQPPDIIVLDILLGKEDGSKIAKELKQNPKTNKIPIILISALPDGEKRAKESKAEAFLAKPFSVDELNEKIEQLVHV